MPFSSAREDIIQQAKRLADRSFLWVGVTSDEAPANISFSSLDEGLTTSNNYDVVVVDTPISSDNTLSDKDSSNKDPIRRVLSRFRDVVGNKVIVLDHDALLSVQEYIDLGFIRLDDSGQIFGYDLYNYRKTPDWLNSDHWANPKRFDKERW